MAAELMLRKQQSTLFDDMIKKLSDHPKLKKMVQDILFCGSMYAFERDNHLIDLGVTLGFIKEDHGVVAVRNRIFETKLYDLFLSEMVMDDAFGQFAPMERNQYIVDYRGRQFIIELKIWRGSEYNQRGEKQLFEYLDYYGTDMGYLLSFNFNQNNTTGIQEITFDGKRILEVTV